MDSAHILAKFEAAVQYFAVGSHAAASEALAEAQQAPSSQLVPLLMQSVILAGDGASDLLALSGGASADAFAFTVQKHFYAFRLISHGIAGDYALVWRPQFEQLVQSVERYLNVNTAILTGAGEGLAERAASAGVEPQSLARMARALSSEISALWAVLWKLELCAAVAAAEESNAVGGPSSSTASSSIDSAFANLASRLTSMLYMCPSLGLEPILTNLVTAACEEFGLTHKASRQRGVSMGTLELTRAAFTTNVLPLVATAAFAALDKCVQRGQSGLNSSSASTDIAVNLSALAAAARLLSVAFSWRTSTCDVRSAFFASSFIAGGAHSAPEVVVLRDRAWQTLLEGQSTTASSNNNSSITNNTNSNAVPSLAVFASLIDCVALLSAVRAGGDRAACGASAELLESALADTLTAFSQLCSVEAQFWGADAKGHFAACAWAAAMRLCSDRTVSGGRPEVMAAACLALQRILSIPSALTVILCSEAAIGTFIGPLTGLTTTVIGLIGEAEAAAATAFLASAATPASSALISFDGDDGANGACEALLGGLDHLLRLWLTIVRDGIEDMDLRAKLPDATAAAISSGSAEVLKCFVKAKVQLHSTQSLLADDGAEAPESSHAIEYANSNTTLIAAIARGEAAGDVCAFLLEQLSGLAGIFVSTYINAGAECPMALNEALWYVLTVAGEFIAFKPDSERPSIPPAFVNLAIRCEKQCPDNVAAQISSNSFFALCSSVFSLAEALSEPVLRGAVSPGVCQAILDVLARYTNTYLLPDPFSQSDRAEAFEVAFNSGTDAAKVVLSFLAVCLKTYGSDPDVARSAAVVLQSLLRLPKEFSQWVLSDAGAGLPPMLSAGAGGVANWFDFYTQCALGGALSLSPVLRAKTIGFLLSVAGYASSADLEALTGGGDDGGFGCFGGSDGARPLTEEAAMTTTIGRFTAHMSGVLSAELSRCAAGAPGASTVSVLECIGGLVEGLGLPLVVSAASLTGLAALVISAIETAVAVHQRCGVTSDRSVLIAAAAMAEGVLVGIGCFFETRVYVAIVGASLQLTQYVGIVARAAGATTTNAATASGNSAANQLLADGNDVIELLTATARLVNGIATWGAMDYSPTTVGGGGEGADPAATEANRRNQLVAQLSVEGLSVVLAAVNETTALIPEFRDEVFRLMKTVTATYAAAMVSLMGAEASAALLQVLSFAFSSGVSDLIESACTIVQSFASHEVEEGRGGGVGGGPIGSLLASFLQRVVGMVLFVPLDPSVTSSVGVALLELARAMGIGAVAECFRAEVAGPTAAVAFGSAAASSALMTAIGAFFTAVQPLDIARPRRDVKLRFGAEVDTLINVAQGVRRLIA